MQRKVLIAVDGSTYSTNSIRYIGRLFHELPDLRLHLFSVVQGGSHGSAAQDWLNEAELLNTASPTTLKSLAAQRKYMEQACHTLKKLGIAPEQIECSVRLSRLGVADDILHEARQGKYDALLIGRRGIGKLSELIIGSVSATILEKCHDVPLWIIDSPVDSSKFLVPVDGSSHSLRAVDHFAFMAADAPSATVTLFYSKALLGSQQTIEPQEFYEIWGKEWCDTHLARPDSLFHAPRQLLIDNGFAEDRIFWVETFSGIDPGRQILKYALDKEFGTVVMGRRGEEVAKGIFRGVSDRVLLMAEELAIWIVG